jgi:L-threonylcarbamoyladenylate synthase
LSPIFDMSDNTVGAAGIAEAVEALQEGDLVGLPTETVYGLAADAGNGKAVARIFAAKGRPHFNPLIVHVLSLAEAEKVAVFDGAARRLAEAFWPGALTLVLPKRPEAGIAELTTAGLDTIAIRVPAHPIARIVLSAFAGPIAAPSANRSGHVSPTTAAHVAEDLGGAVACILDAGPTGIGLESTIVGFPKGRATLLRPGGIARTDIERVLGSELAMAEEGTAVSAPGMLASHYAPAASLRLNAADVRPGEALLAFGSRLLPGSNEAAVIQNLSETGDLTEAAANLFAALRALDRQASAIAVVPIPYDGLGEAINDRLQRAAAPKA